MRIDAGGEAEIRRYLLGEVTEDQREQLEKRLMTDDEFFDQVGLLEDELVDEYVDDTLSQPDRRRFEEWFLCTAERQQKLRLARALRAYAALAARRTATAPAPAEPHWWEVVGHGFSKLFAPPVRAFAYAQIAALLLLMGGGSVLVVRIAGLEGRISELQVLRQGQDAQVDAQRRRADAAENRLRQEEEKIAALEAATRSGQQTLAVPIVTSPALVPGLQRAAGQSNRLEIPASALLVRLRLDLPENRYRSYKAVLRSEGQEIFARSLLEASETRDRITLVLEVPASMLPPGDYEISLHGAGEEEAIATYVFRAVRK